MCGYTPAGRMANDASSGQQKGTELLPGTRDSLVGELTVEIEALRGAVSYRATRRVA